MRNQNFGRLFMEAVTKIDDDLCMRYRYPFLYTFGEL